MTDDGWKTAGRLLAEDTAVRQSLGASPHETTKAAAERLANLAGPPDDADEATDRIVELFAWLSPEARVDAMLAVEDCFCRGCGDTQAEGQRCQCQNDE